MIYHELVLFIIYFLAGTLIGILFDFFRALRRVTKTTEIIILFQDILFVVLTGVSVIVLIGIVNYGEPRLYIFVGIMLGIIIYYLFISTIVLNFFIMNLNFLKRVLKFINKPICFIIINIRKVSKKLKK